MNPNPTPNQTPFVPTEKLSPRELEALNLRNKGYIVQEVASLMGVEKSTAKTLLQRAFRKLNVGNIQSALYEAKGQLWT